MAAATAAVLRLSGPGKTIALGEGCYYGTTRLFELLAPWGVRYVEYDQAGEPPDGADLVWIEIPGNPLLTVPDLEAAAAHPAPVVCDATAATPVLCRPLEHGVDVVLHSATKYLGGHHDVLLGALVCRDEALHAEIKATRMQTGAIAYAGRRLAAPPEPEDARAARPAPVGDGARARAPPRRAPARRGRALPGLGPDPLAARYMHGGFGGLLSFDVADADAARRVETATRLIVERDQPRRRRHDDRGPVPLGGRPRAAGTAPAQRRGRGRRSALGRPRAGARKRLRAGGGTRTHGLRITNPLLYQLSYSGVEPA